MTINDLRETMGSVQTIRDVDPVQARQGKSNVVAIELEFALNPATDHSTSVVIDRRAALKLVGELARAIALLDEMQK